MPKKGSVRRRFIAPSPALDAAGWPGFFEYSCGNGKCLLSRFETFAMAASIDSRCPVCGETVVCRPGDAGLPRAFGSLRGSGGDPGDRVQ